MSKQRRFSMKMTERARALRKEAPYPERALWMRLRAGHLQGVRFRRQHVIGPYIADFYCPSAKLVIELDGLSHETRETYDRRRTGYLEAQGLRVIRFTDDEVIQDIDLVVSQIANEIGLEC